MKYIIYILLLLLSFKATARTFFVSSSIGNDANSGLTTTAPWKTLSKVSLSAFLPGDVILFNRGDIFLGSLTVSSNGATGNPISYGAYGSGDMPVITGFVTVSTWTNLGGNIFESSSSVSTLSTCNMVVIGGVNFQMGRTPNVGYYTINSGVGQTQLTSSSLNSSVINYVGAQVVQRKVAWITDRSVITAHAGTTITFGAADMYNVQAGWGFFIEDDARTLDIQNEWYYSPTTKKIRIFSASQPANVQVTTVDTLVKISNRHDITFDGIKFTGSNKISFQMAAQNLTIQNCIFDYAGVDAVWGGANISPSTGFVFQNNYINHTNNNSLLIRSNFSGALIQNNVIKNSGMQEGMLSFVSNSNQFGMGIEIRAAGVTCQFNEVDSSGYAGIEFFGNNILVQKNFINGALLTLGDGGGIYTWVGEGTGTTPFVGCQILNNIVFNCLGKNEGTTFNSPPLTQGEGIYADDLSANIEIAGNTVAYCGFSSYFLHNTNNMNVHDNTGFSSNRVFEYSSSDTFAPIRNTILKNNQFVAATTTQLAAFASSSTHISNDIQQFGNSTTIDSNIYALPLADNITIKSNISPSSGNFVLGSYNLAMWKTFCTYDVHSTKSPIAITSASQLFFAYNPTNNDSTVTLPSGSWINFKSASFSGTTVLHGYSSIVLLSTGAQTTPIITWIPASPKVYGYLLDNTTLNATANTTGTFAYNPNFGALLPAGVDSLRVLFTPSNGTLFTTATKTVAITINPAPSTIAVTDTIRQYTGLPLAPTITTAPPGLATALTYNNLGATPINAGTYAGKAANADPNHTAPVVNFIYQITPKPGTITVSNLLQPYNGSGKTVSVATSDPFTTVTTYDGSPTPSVNAGNHIVITRNTNTNYLVKPDTSILVISQATFTVAWSNPANGTYPTALGGSQLNATPSIPAILTYIPAAGTVLTPGSHVLTVNATPIDSLNYAKLNGTTVVWVVNKGAATISVIDTIQSADGTPKFVSASTTPSNIDTLTITYDDSHTSVGDHTGHVTLSSPLYTATTKNFTLHITSNAANIYITNYSNLPYTGSNILPTVTTSPPSLAYTIRFNGSLTPPQAVGSYQAIATLTSPNVGADTVTMTIIKATPTATWPPITAGTYPYTVQVGILNASSPVSGTWAYSVSVNDTIPVGTQTITGTFTPTDAANYNVLVINNSITVNKGNASMSFANTIQTFDGSVKTVLVNTVPANLAGVLIGYTGGHTAAGTYPISASLTNANWQSNPIGGTLTINKSSDYVLTWNQPTGVQQGTVVTAAILNPSSNIAGTFTFNYPIGYVLNNPGTISLIGTFHPSNPNYNDQVISVALSVFGDPVDLFYIIHGNGYYDNLPGQNFNFPP